MKTFSPEQLLKMKRRIIQTAIESMTVRSKRKKGKEFDPN
jgi:hypothetical protein